MITHRNAWVNCVGTMVHVHMTPADRYLWTLPMFHANGWTFVWTITAAGGTHVCLPKVDFPLIFELIERERVTMMCAAPTVLIGIANAPEPLRRGARKGVRVITAGAPPAAATIERIEEELGWGRYAGVRAHGNHAVHYGLRTALGSAFAGARTRDVQSATRRRVDHLGRASRTRRRRPRSPARRRRDRRNRRSRKRGDGRLL